MLELKNIHKSYRVGGEVQHVLKGININFRKSEFVSILGQSGSGKTTLLNIIGGLDKYDGGDLIIDGVSTKNYKDRDFDSYRNHRVGFIFQNYNLISHQTILANVELSLTLSGISKKERIKKAKEALIKVGLKDHLNKRPNQLSGGQMQRVAIARALVNDPNIILADEPTGALDSETSIQIMQLLKEISKDKLIIMVTHNPELAHNYSTRIIELKDGQILNDSNPFDEITEEVNKVKTDKTSMSLWTSLTLSFNNLMTKKGRTFLTAFAGSIGIVGIALILSLSTGVSNYVANVEKESLSDYPITIKDISYDYSKILDLEMDKDKKCSDGKICSSDDISNQVDLLSNGFIKKNNLSEFKKYIESKDEFKEYTSDIKYGYNLDLQIYSMDHVKVNPNTFNVINKDDIPKEDEEDLSLMIDNHASIFEELIDNDELLKSEYDILKGRLPDNYDEMVLVVNENNNIPDSVLYALDIKDRNNLTNNKPVKYSYEDILNKKYKLILNTDYYKYENGKLVDYSNDLSYMKNVIDNGVDIKIVGILRAKKDSYSSGFVGYTKNLREYVITEISKTEIYKVQTANKDIDIFTGEKFDQNVNSYKSNAEKLGLYDLDNPNSINIYPKNFDSKEKIIKLINEYNDKKSKNDKISYTDLIKTFVNGVISIINIVSIILIGFVAISLIVSSIMISIITYISVLERTKEIGILRAIGASKKDIKRVFRAETIIEGLIAGILGISITLLMNVSINMVVKTLAHIDKIANLKILSMIILILLSVGITVIAGIRPAKKASKQDPVEALRTE